MINGKAALTEIISEIFHDHIPVFACQVMTSHLDSFYIFFITFNSHFTVCSYYDHFDCKNMLLPEICLSQLTVS